MLLISLRIFLQLLPTDKLYSYIQKILRQPSDSYQNHRHYTFRVIRAVETCGRYLLRTRCLGQALAALILLNRRSIACQLKLGFIPGSGKHLAHAWLVADQDVLTGRNEKLHLYLPIDFGQSLLTTTHSKTLFVPVDDHDPEMSLLLYCLRRCNDPSSTPTTAATFWRKKSFDWDRFLYLTWLNKVIPAVWSELIVNTCPQLPERVIQELQNAHDDIVAHHITNIVELKKLLTLLHDHNLPAIPFKGAALGAFYRRASERQWGDLDIIIRKQDVRSIVRLLESVGYRDVVQPDGLTLDELLGKHHAYYMDSPDGRVQIDIHWSLTEYRDEIRYSTDSIWEYAIEQPFFDIHTTMLSPEHLLLTTCIHHGARNGWDELRLIVDLDQLITAHPNADWNGIFIWCNRLGTLRSMLVGLSLAHDLLATPLPNEAKRLIAADGQIAKIQAAICRQLAARHNLKRLLAVFWIKIRIRENLGTRLALFWHLLTDTETTKLVMRPNELDMRVLSLPHSFRFVYYIIRPFRLINKFVLKVGV